MSDKLRCQLLEQSGNYDRPEEYQSVVKNSTYILFYGDVDDEIETKTETDVIGFVMNDDVGWGDIIPDPFDEKQHLKIVVLSVKNKLAIVKFEKATNL